MNGVSLRLGDDAPTGLECAGVAHATRPVPKAIVDSGGSRDSMLTARPMSKESVEPFLG
jgi:hypothetical protein